MSSPENDPPKSMILNCGCEKNVFTGYDAGSTKYGGMPGSSGLPSFLVMWPICGFPSFSRSSTSFSLCKEGITNAKLRVCRSANYQPRNFR